jgi:hypothetical protein
MPVVEEILRGRLAVYADHLPKLNQDGLAALVDWLASQRLPQGFARLVAECMACQHRDHLTKWGYGPRNSDLNKQATTLQAGALAFRAALKGMSKELNARLSCSLYEIEPNAEPAEKQIIRLPVQTPRSLAATGLLSSEQALKDLLDATASILKSIPKDKGGQASGAWDPTGKKAKEHLVVESRWLLNELGLQVGAKKSGPLAEFIERVHTAATNEPEGWADPFAERAKKLEEEMNSGVF